MSSQEIEKRIDAIWDFYLETNDEDIVACELVQEGIQIESYQGGRMSFRFEETIHRFQNMLAVSFYVFRSFFFQSFLQNFF